MSNKILPFILAAALFIAPGAAQAKIYTVDPQASSISFVGKHAGKDFKGAFGTWTATIDFDPANLPGSSLKATFDPASAKTGSAMFDGTLPQADWFDVKNHPQAVFESTSITATPEGLYKAEGALTIRGISQPVTFLFTLTDPTVNPVKAEGTLAVDRLAFDIGKKSDAAGEWVSPQIDVTLSITASAP